MSKKFCMSIKAISCFAVFSLLLLNITTVCFAQLTTETTTDEISVPIIMYHQVKPNNSGKDIITPYEFESDLKYLVSNNYTTISMTELIDYVYNGAALPENPIVLSFDDGYYNNYKYVFPLLKKYNEKIVLSIICKSTDDFSEYPDDNIDYAHVTWDQINEMSESGLVEIQNHTYDLHKMSIRFGCTKNNNESQEQYMHVLTKDIEKAQNQITTLTGVTPNTFNYPYGKYSNLSEDIIKKLGFKASLTCDYGVNVITRDAEALFGLKRICRSHGVPLEKLL